jgi:hypothetical protein
VPHAAAALITKPQTLELLSPVRPRHGPSGHWAARPQRRPRRPKLDPHEALLREWIAEREVIILEEMRTGLREDQI